MNFGINQDDFEYAFESTKIISAPERFIDTFGVTRFNFLMASELMDSVNKVCVRAGVIETQKPQIIKPEPYASIDFNGFSPEAQTEAQQFFDWLEKSGHNLAFLKYGFEFKKQETREEIVHEPLENVIGKLKEEARASGNPSLAILEVIEDSWEVGLIKFTIHMIEKSHHVNISDYKRNGLI